ncbi:MAG: AAA family ATPase [Bacteroidota bacterium]
MKKLYPTYPFLLRLLLLTTTALVIPSTVQSDNEDPIARVQVAYKKAYLDEKTYFFPKELSNQNSEFLKLSDIKKEEFLKNYFQKERKDLLVYIASQDFHRSISLVLAGVVSLLAITNYVGLLRIIWLGLQLPFKDTTTEIKSESKKFFDMILYISSLANLPSRQLRGGTTNQSKGVLISVVTLYYGLKYLAIPLSWFIRQVSNSWLLYRYMQAPVYSSNVLVAESIFVRSAYLFGEKEKQLIIPLLLRGNRGEIRQPEDLEDLIRTMRALPKNVKPINQYSEEAFNKEFGHYSKEKQAFIKGYISIIMMVTEALQQGRPNPLEGLPFKGILLVGGEGTGKTNFWQALCRLTGLQATEMNLFSEFRPEFNGRNRYQNMFGIPSEYVTALRASADEEGKNYQNGILVFPELDAHFDDPMVVDFLKVFLDPRAKKVRDAYVNVPVFKLPFIFATANRLPKSSTLRERFLIITFDKIEPHNKKGIIKDQVELWATFLTAYQNQQHRKAEVVQALTKKTHRFIDKEDAGGSMRRTEEKVMKESMALSEKIRRKVQKQKKARK